MSAYGRLSDLRRETAQALRDLRFDTTSAAAARRSLERAAALVGELELAEREMAECPEDER